MRLSLAALGLLYAALAAAIPPPPPSPKAIAFCKYIQTCSAAHPGKPAYCVKTGLKESQFLDHVLEGDQAKDLSRFLRKEGFVDKEIGLKEFSQLPDGAILVLDAHDPVKDKRPACPKVYGNVLVKCDGHWLDGETYELNFHMKRGCRSKGIWVHPSLVVAPVQPLVKRPITTPAEAPPADESGSVTVPAPPPPPSEGNDPAPF